MEVAPVREPCPMARNWLREPCEGLPRNFWVRGWIVVRVTASASVSFFRSRVYNPLSPTRESLHACLIVCF
jgi:hypothetical protein